MPTMTGLELEAKVKSIVSEIFESPLEKITGETRLDALGGDSLDYVEIFMEIEDQFKIPEIPFEIGDHLETVGQLICYVAGAMAAKN